MHEVWCGGCAGVKAVSAAVALLEASVSHDAMHSSALRLVLSPSILPQIAQPLPDGVILSSYPQQATVDASDNSSDVEEICHTCDLWQCQYMH